MAHAPINGDALEEFFAYRASQKKLRRYLGNCFIYSYDALIFLLPCMILLCVELINLFGGQSIPLWPFWTLTLGGPAWLMARNQRWRCRYFKAEKLLKSLKLPAEKILFRCTETEICQLGKLKNKSQWQEFLAEKMSKSLRFKVINYRFIKERK